MPSGNIDGGTLARTAQRIQELETRKTRLLQEASQVDEEIQNTRAVYGRMLNGSLPICMLPNELLVSIFRAGQELTYSSTRLPWFEFIASQVCHHWRETVIGAPLLWTNVYVRLSLSVMDSAQMLQRKLDRLNVYLERSQTCPFDATLEINGSHDIPRFLFPITRHIHRCQRLSIHVGHHIAPVREIHGCLQSLTAAQLQSLSIRVGSSPHYPHDHTQYHIISPQIFVGGAPQLHNVRLSGVAGPLQPPLPFLTTFHIDGTDMDSVSYNQYRDLLEALPKIQNLSLQRIHINPLPRQPYPPRVDLPHLCSLRLYAAVDQQPSYLLSALPVSQLEMLVLKEVETISPSQFPLVHTLVMHCCSIPLEELLHLEKALPAVTTLHCDFSTPLILMMLGWTPEELSYDVPLWPKLQTLSVMDMEPSDVRYFVDMVHNRCKMPDVAPFGRLLLDRRCRNVLRSKNELDRLQGVVAVDKCEAVASWPEGVGYDDDDDGFWD